MYTEVYINGERIYVSPSQLIGKGGEADVYDLHNGTALKIFKPPTHIDFEGMLLEQLGAKERIQEHQTKLPSFPKSLPDRVITPIDLARSREYLSSLITGYTMKYLKDAEVLKRYSELLFRQSVDTNMVIEIFRDLHPTLQSIHSANVVIGDFNDLNVLVAKNKAYIVDADSMQFGKYFCKVFTARFVDPLLCDPTGKSLQLIKPHNKMSDWYAFTIMLMQSLLFVDPYGGIYKPKDKNDKIPHTQRPLKRITVFDPDVIYPKPAIPYSVLPDEILECFIDTFKKDLRKPFPISLINNLRWTKCKDCGTEYARSKCPKCSRPNELAVKQTITIRGRATANRFFRTHGQIVFASYQKNELYWLYQEDGKLKRDTGNTIASMVLEPGFRFRIQGPNTLLGKNNTLITFDKDGNIVDQMLIDKYGSLPMFDCTRDTTFWLSGGHLQKSTLLGPEYVGDILKDQTLFWTGEHFGFGFYRANELTVAFVFDNYSRGINDSVSLPILSGQLFDSTCFFSKERVWFFTSMKMGPKIMNRCMVIKRDGKLEATAETEEGDGTWLGNIRGKCAVNNFLLAATDQGIVRLETDNNKIQITRSFPDTEPFVSSGFHIFPAPDGLYVISKREITLLKIT